MNRYPCRERNMRDFIARFNEIKTDEAPAAPQYENSYERLKALAMEAGWSAGIKSGGSGRQAAQRQPFPAAPFPSPPPIRCAPAPCPPAADACGVFTGVYAEYGATEAEPGQTVEPGAGIVFSGILQGLGRDIKIAPGSPVISLCGGHTYLVMAAISGSSPEGLDFQLRLDGLSAASVKPGTGGGLQSTTGFNFVAVRGECGPQQLQIVNASPHAVEGLRASVAVMEIV